MKTKLLVATAFVLANLAPVAIAPAFAQVDPGVQAELDAYCVSIVPPEDHNPNFIITAINVVEGATTGGTVTTVLTPGTEHRHGGSPNIFSFSEVTTSGGFTTYSFDCQTENPNAGGEGQFPEGLQRPGQITQVEAEGSSTVIGDPVICNSPTRNPGTWRNQNGYVPSCTTLATTSPGFYALPLDPAPPGIGTPIPSNSLPQ
jgi:hypothetical protein